MAKSAINDILDRQVQVGCRGNDHTVFAAGFRKQSQTGPPRLKQLGRKNTSGQNNRGRSRIRNQQLAGGAVIAAGLFYVKPWLATIDHTSWDGALRLATVLAPAGALYVGLVTLLGGRELSLLLSTSRGGAKE